MSVSSRSPYDGTPQQFWGKEAVLYRLTEEETFELIDLAFRPACDAFMKLRELQRSGHEFERKSSYPKFATADGHTFRKVESTGGSDSVPNYGDVFSNDNRWGTKFRFDELDGFEELVNFVNAHDELRQFHLPSGGRDDFRTHVLRVNIGNLPVTAVEKHIFHEGWKLNRERLQYYIAELVIWWVSRELPVDIVVPILNVSFDADQFSLDDRVVVERLSSELQLARWPGRPRANAYADVLPMATHALVLEGWKIVNPNALGWLWNPDDKPIDVPALDRFFQTLVTFVPEPTGYAQILYRPRGWIHDCRGRLPDLIQGPLLPRFSASLQPAQEPQVVMDSGQIELLRNGFSSFNDQYGSISIAAHRLSEAERRDNDVDRILDLCIGIEALVAGSPGDATYKIQVRIAAVLADIGIANSVEIMNAAKAVYSLRSAVAHGRGKPTRYSQVLLKGRQVETIEAARYFLRNLLKARLSRPTLTTDDIDTRILGGALTRWALAEASANDGASEGTED